MTDTKDRWLPKPWPSTEDEIRAEFEDWYVDYCRNQFIQDDEEKESDAQRARSDLSIRRRNGAYFDHDIQNIWFGYRNGRAK